MTARRCTLSATCSAIRSSKVVGHVDLIQSVGSLELLDEIERVAAKPGIWCRTFCWK